MVLASTVHGFLILQHSRSAVNLPPLNPRMLGKLNQWYSIGSKGTRKRTFLVRCSPVSHRHEIPFTPHPPPYPRPYLNKQRMHERVIRLLHELGLDLSATCDAAEFGSAIFYSVMLGRVECLEVLVGLQILTQKSAPSKKKRSRGRVFKSGKVSEATHTRRTVVHRQAM